MRNSTRHSTSKIRRRGVLGSTLLAGALAGALLTAGPADAHATVQLYGSEPAAGGYGHMFLRIPHGCDGARATDTVTVSIPAGFTSVKPERTDGWKTRIGRNEKGRVSSVTWYDGNLPDDHFEDFGLSVKYPGKPGTYHLPTVQRCGSASVAWDQVAKTGVDPHALDRPAPSVTVTRSDHGATMTGTGKALGTALGKEMVDAGPKEHDTRPGTGRGEVAALVFNGRVTVIADLPSTLRGRMARIVLEQGDTRITLGWGSLDRAGDLIKGYPTAQSGPEGWRISNGDVISVVVNGALLAQVVVETKK